MKLGKSFVRYFMVLLSIGIILGFIFAYFSIDIWALENFMVIGGTMVLLLVGAHIYILLRSKDIKLIDKYLKVYRDFLGGDSYTNFVVECYVHGNFEEAEKNLRTFKKGTKGLEIKHQLLTGLYIEINDIAKAKTEVEKIEDTNRKNLYLAVIAQHEENWEEYYEFKEKIKDKNSLQGLEVEEAFRKGEVEKAKKLGNELIKNSLGLRRYILIKSLERKEKQRDRRSYF